MTKLQRLWVLWFHVADTQLSLPMHWEVECCFPAVFPSQEDVDIRHSRGSSPCCALGSESLRCSFPPSPSLRLLPGDKVRSVPSAARSEALVRAGWVAFVGVSQWKFVIGKASSRRKFHGSVRECSGESLLCVRGDLAVFCPLNVSNLNCLCCLRMKSGYYPFLLQVRGSGVHLIPLSFGIFRSHYKRN